MIYELGDAKRFHEAFENLLDDYPDTDFREEILYYTVKAYYEYAENSIYSKQRERYENTVETFNTLKYMFPESKYLEELEDINLHAKQKLK